MTSHITRVSRPVPALRALDLECITLSSRRLLLPHVHMYMVYGVVTVGSTGGGGGERNANSLSNQKFFTHR